MTRASLHALLMVFLLLTGMGCTMTDVNTVTPADFIQNSSFLEKSSVAVLAPGDTVEVSVEVDGRMEVVRHRVGIDYHGVVTLPLVGDVSIGGLKLDEARKAIFKTYSSYYVNSPLVMLSTVEDVDAGEWGFVTITGRIARPGLVRIPTAAGIKLTAAIQEAGGFTASAKTSDILVSRVDGSGRKIQVSVNYNQIGQQGNAEADINLVDGDIVYVPERIF